MEEEKLIRGKKYIFITAPNMEIEEALYRGRIDDDLTEFPHQFIQRTLFTCGGLISYRLRDSGYRQIDDVIIPHVPFHKDIFIPLNYLIPHSGPNEEEALRAYMRGMKKEDAVNLLKELEGVGL